jgi:hypothetical protein
MLGTLSKDALSLHTFTSQAPIRVDFLGRFHDEKLINNIVFLCCIAGILEWELSLYTIAMLMRENHQFVS